MSNAKRKAPVLKAKQKEEINKKALIWIGAVVVVVIVAVSILLIVSQ